MRQFANMRIKKGDQVKIISGKDRGKSGKILRVLPAAKKVVVEKLNLMKRHVRPRKEGEKGQIVEVPSPIDISNVMLACSNCGKSVRVGYKIEGEKKIRFCKKCKSEVSK